jgi:hypothetical protein
MSATPFYFIDITKPVRIRNGYSLRNLRKSPHGSFYAYTGEVFDPIDKEWKDLDWFLNGICDHFWYPPELDLICDT